MHRTSSDASEAAGYVLDAPYPETFFRELSPAWLNYVAALNGAMPRDVDRPFTYLELGCGLGSSVITNAGAFPRGRFHACDINRTYVEHARNRAKAFGIPNVQFYQSSFNALLREPLPMFDFIAAHGVYSWVAAQERQAIRHLIREHLAPGGLVYLSYNSLPGWASELPLRKLLVELADGESASTTMRAERALRCLQDLAKQRLRFLDASPASAAAIGAYAAAPASYLAHEFLNETWEPFYGVDVADQLQEARVVYLGSATLADNHATLLVPESTLRSIGRLTTARQRRLALDFATNQQFRRDVFIGPVACREIDTSPLDRTLIGCIEDLREPRELKAIRVPRGVLHFQETFLSRLGELFRQGPLEIGIALAGLGTPGEDTEECRRNLLYLVAAGLLMPFAKRSAHSGARGCRAASAVIERMLRYSAEHQLACVLPSETLGNGVWMRPAQATAILQCLEGGDIAAADTSLVQRLLRCGILSPG